MSPREEGSFFRERERSTEEKDIAPTISGDKLVG
jgi:hypothetical protein